MVVVQLMTAFLDSEKDVASSNISQTSQARLNQDVLADSKSFYLVCSKIYTEKITYIPGLKVPTEMVLDMIHPVSGTNRSITTDN